MENLYQQKQNINAKKFTQPVNRGWKQLTLEKRITIILGMITAVVTIWGIWLNYISANSAKLSAAPLQIYIGQQNGGSDTISSSKKSIMGADTVVISTTVIFKKRHETKKRKRVMFINTKKAVKPKSDKPAYNKTITEKQDSAATANYGVHNKLLSISSYPDNDEPTIDYQIDNNVYTDYDANVGGVAFWTDCRDCDWLVCSENYSKAFEQGVFVAIEKPTYLPPYALFKKDMGNTNFLFSIKNKKGKVYQYFEIKIVPQATVMIHISKK